MRPQYSTVPCLCGCGRFPTAGRRFISGHNSPKRSLEDRFWEKVRKSDGCWLWIGARSPSGYGHINAGGHNGDILYAHRVSYELHFGPIPEGLDVCHSCDKDYPPGDITYRSCVRPDHFFLGTQAENIADMGSKGRNHMQTHPETTRGERNGRAKLTVAGVREVRRLVEEGLSKSEVARRFGVSQTAVHYAVTGKTWRGA
jgi:hypothetical protein